MGFQQMLVGGWFDMLRHRITLQKLLTHLLARLLHVHSMSIIGGNSTPAIRFTVFDISCDASSHRNMVGVIMT